MRLAKPVHNAGLWIVTHSSRSQLVDTKAWHGGLPGQVDVFAAGRFEHFSSLLASVSPQFALVIAPVGMNLENRNAPRVHAVAIDLDVIVSSGETLRPQVEIDAPAAPAHGLFVSRAKARRV